MRRPNTGEAVTECVCLRAMKGKEREKKRGKGRERERGLTKVLYISASEGDGERI